MKDFGTPEQVAKAVAFLASDEADYITGQVLHGRRWYGNVTRGWTGGLHGTIELSERQKCYEARWCKCSVTRIGWNKGEAE